ncbi:sensor histidine kinase [Nitrincola alkalilacustris]|uniref:sensor histidine kinase n=1 Tax=Nitrincola alkalilacustris TaxID=1571224 RepID=UPI00124F72E6|nr:HAMP domain-containing sensor histidine kinase [Nitrincola alkalilacustris]
MRWYQHLFWRIFITTWLFSSLTMGLLIYGLMTVTERRHGRDLYEERLLSQAQTIIERHESGESSARFPREEGHRRWRFPLQILDLDTGQNLVELRRPLPEGPRVRLTYESDTGRQYQILAPMPQEQFRLQRLYQFGASLQMIMVAVVAALVALLTSLLVVRPVNQLRQYARALHDQQNLSTRAEGHLSARRDEIGELAREFNLMAAFVEKTLTGQQRLLQDVSHELRAPLARLQVAAGLIEQQLGERNRSVDQINRECEQLSHLIEELLSLSRLEQQSGKVEPCHLISLLESLVTDAQLTSPEHEVVLSVEPVDLRCDLNGDLLRRAVGNALGNALKHTPGGSRIEVQAHHDGSNLWLSVVDNGPGVDNSLLKTLFNPFVRGHHSPSDGYGLGLSILQRAVQHMDGRVSAANRSEGGFELVMKIPAKLA